MVNPVLDPKVKSLLDQLRQGQREMGEWRGGTLAVSAVPGAGKSYGMAVAAAIALSRIPKFQTQQIVLVTFTRSAAISLKRKVKENLALLELPNQGYTVQTLHSLALSIANQHPQQSGIRLDQMTLISPYRGHQLIQETVDAWIQNNPTLYRILIEQGEFDGEETNRLQRQSVLNADILPAIASIFIQEAKSSGLTPEDLYTASSQESTELPLIKIGAGLYQIYESLLQSRQLIDYEDMILGALKALQTPAIRTLWQEKILAVFEDEAQDSTPLQFQLLDCLAQSPGQAPNLIRVGDANQAINSSFTPADPKYFRQFCSQQQDQGRLAHMVYAGRSNPLILETANRFLQWVNQAHGSVFIPQIIQPVPEEDPQPNANPPMMGNGVEVVFPSDVYRSVDAIASRIIQLYEQDPELTYAILVRENKQGQFVADVLANPQKYDLEFELPDSFSIYDVGQAQQMSNIPRQLLTLLQFVARPHSPTYLQETLELLIQRQLIASQDISALVGEPERFLYPSPLDNLQAPEVMAARQFCTKLLRARSELPQVQLISFLALALAYNPEELATADKLASRIIQQTQDRRSLESIISALQSLLNSERFEAVTIDPEQQNLCRDRQITILTMHKAKGLDWDVVFLPFLHESLTTGRTGVSQQSRFLGEISLPDTSRHLIRGWAQDQQILSIEQAGKTAQALKIAEEYRLLYVAMTRPKKLLWMSACDFAPFWWGGFQWDRPDSLQSQSPIPFLTCMSTQSLG